jgi:tRNA threonylcarbamoyladenosine biosynthesis protein TsaE
MCHRRARLHFPARQGERPPATLAERVESGDHVRELHLRTSGPSETRALAGIIARALRPGDVVALTGELGAGKTCFVQGAAGALGVTERVTSPSFVLRREYLGRIPVIHLDIYRMETLAEIVDLGFEEIFDSDYVTFIEWGDAMSPLLPDDYLEVELRYLESPRAAASETVEDAPNAVAGGEARRLVVRAHGGQWRERLAALEGALQSWDEQASDDQGSAPFASPPGCEPDWGG